jgi:hypothetical protein
MNNPEHEACRMCICSLAGAVCCDRPNMSYEYGFLHLR